MIGRALTIGVVAGVGLSCHSVLLKVERRGTAALFDQGGIHPRPFFDRHAIPFPAAPFVNCFDLLGPRMPQRTCSVPRVPDGRRKCKLAIGDKQTLRMRPNRYVGYARELIPTAGNGAAWQQADASIDEGPVWLRSARLDDQRRALDEIVREFDDDACGGALPADGELATTIATGETSAPVDATQARPSEPAKIYTATLAPGPKVAGKPHAVLFTVANDPVPHAAWLDENCDAAGACTPTLTAVGFAFRTGEQIRIGGAPLLAEPVASFIHISDIQIREPAAKLGGQQVSDKLDPLIQSFQHDYDQELYSAFLYQAFVTTINAEFGAGRCDRERLAAYRLDEKGRCEAEAKACGFAADLCQLHAPTLAGIDVHMFEYRPPPAFSIHTGDAIDAGLVSEFDEFRSRSDQLVIPWYSVIGNHDVLGFGNLDLRMNEADKMGGTAYDGTKYDCTPTRRILQEYHLRQPTKNGDLAEAAAARDPAARPFSLATAAINNICLAKAVDNDRLLAAPSSERPDEPDPTQRFIGAHCRGDYTPELGCSGPDVEHEVPDGAGLPQYASGPSGVSTLNGFDLNITPPSPEHEMWRSAGYYRFEIPHQGSQYFGTGRTLWAVVLDTSSLEGAFGAVGPEQLQWLTCQLPADHTDASKPIKPWDEVLVFAHHPLWKIADDKQRAHVKKLLVRAGNVVALLAGHTHSPQLRAVGVDVAGSVDDRRGRFWEIVGPSVIGFPQQARQVTMKVIPGSSLGYLEILSFEPHLLGSQQDYVIAAMRGAERDACDEDASACVHGRPRLPENRVMFPRLFFRLAPPEGAGPYRTELTRDERRDCAPWLP